MATDILAAVLMVGMAVPNQVVALEELVMAVDQLAQLVGRRLVVLERAAIMMLLVVVVVVDIMAAAAVAQQAAALELAAAAAAADHLTLAV